MIGIRIKYVLTLLSKYDNHVVYVGQNEALCFKKNLYDVLYILFFIKKKYSLRISVISS